MAKKDRPTVYVTVAKFDHAGQGGAMRYTNVRDSVKIDQFKELTTADYKPMGLTPLRDATGKFINSLDADRAKDRVVVGLLLDESGSMSPNQASVISGVNEYVQSMLNVEKVDRKSAGKVFAVILTDGLENMSTEFTPEVVGALIKAKESEGWTFIYMGANQDAWAVAGAAGYSGTASGQSVNFQSTAKGTKSALRYAGASTADYLSDNDSYGAQVMASGMVNATVEEDGTVTGKDEDPQPVTPD